MKVRIIAPGTAASAKLTAVSCAALTVLVSATVAACTSSPGTAPSISQPSVITTGVHTGSASASPKGTGTGSRPATSTPTPPASHSARASQSTAGRPSVTATGHGANPGHTTKPATQKPGHTVHTPAPATTRIPAGAPATGGGGTAGLQDGVLFGIGGAAILAGIGSLAYRRRLTRTR